MNPTDHVTGPWCNDLAIMVIRERWPQLKHGQDYFVAHPVDANREPAGPPFFIYWNVADIEPPDMAELEAAFHADEARYRAALARFWRDQMLAWSDAKMIQPPDAPLTRQASAWQAWRQALRDVPQQPGFPFAIDWPAVPQD